MYTILQLSDFHIKENMPDPENNPVIKSLVGYLKSLELGTIILVYNGDVIDSNAIRKKIPSKTRQNNKQKIWDQEAEVAFTKAEKYFDYIMRELGIDNMHVVICCGNHDVNNYYENTDTIICPYDDAKNEIGYNPKRFDKWVEFCQRMRFSKISYENTVQEIDNFNFIISNCQWRDKYVKKKRRTLCMNCDSILDVFKENETKLAQAKSAYNKANIFVAHNPFGDICEDEQFGWPENKYTSIINKVNDLCTIQLFGDKHTGAALGAQYIVGAPLDVNDYKDKKQRIVYRLHQFKDEKILHKAIVYERGLWKTWYDQSDLSKIYEISKDALRDRALEFLFNNKDRDLVLDKIADFDVHKKSKEWKKVNNLFRLSVNVSVVKSNGGSSRVPHDVYGVIDTVCSAINNHDSDAPEVSMILQGDYRSGKSTFVSILYIDMLSGFNNGTFRNIPVYINLEALEKQCIATRKKRSYIKSLVKNTLESMKQLTEDFHHKVCLIIDGIPQYRYSSESEYDNIKILVNEYNDYIGNYVYCIDTSDQLEYEHSLFYKDAAKYLTYFGDISTQVFGSDSHYREYLNAFCDIENINEKRSTILSNFDTLCFKNIDFCLMTVLKDTLRKDEGTINLTQEIKNKLHNRLGGRDRNLVAAAQAAYLLYFENMDFGEIKRTVNTQKNSNLFSAIRIKIYSQYLIALNYVNIIKRTRNSIDTLSSTDKSALNQLYEDDISRFIIESLNDEIQPKTLVDFEKNNYKLLDFSGKSMLTYVMGKVKYKDSLVDILKREETELEDYYNNEIAQNNELQSRRLYEYYVAKRSIDIGLTRNDADYHDRNAYIIKLLNDKDERRINREFYMEFYGDRTKSDLELQEEVILKGLDFYHTYHMLAQRLAKWENGGLENELSRLELFTLCDLIQVRLDNPKITHKRVRHSLHKVNLNDSGNESLFYNAEYNNSNKKIGENVLETALHAICFYIEKNKSKENLDIFVQYLRFEKQIFKTAKEKLSRGNLEYKDDTGALFRTLTQLGKTRKVGWYFESTPKRLIDEDISKAVEGRELIESVLEHVYESYIIGLLYLPNEDKLCKEYKKQDVLNMLLIHDLGENEMGDYPPSYYEYDRILAEERTKCRAYYFAGQHPEYATMIDYLKLWDAWASNSDNINIRIAKEIDKIQMLYKLLMIIKERKAIFTEDRFHNFFEAVGGIRTQKGRSIYNKIIAHNSEFVELAKGYNYSIVPI